ncbi:hypothetical protein CFSAN002075_20160, partial [Salmonella enterica subsp. enterica serovar Heidelberg str. CFSAN002075]
PKFPKFSRISVFRAFSLYQIQIQFNIFLQQNQSIT